MDQKDVFGLALGLAGTPWKVVEIRFDGHLKRLNIEVDFPPGSRFPHPESGEACAVYDSEPRSWRHLNFFQFECYVHAHVPRVEGGPGSGVKRVEVPWARPHSGFTLFMESMVLLLARSGMTVAEAARTVGEYPQRVWTVLLHHVAEAHGRMDLGEVRVVSVDEVCRARGQNYLTIASEPRQEGRPTRVLPVLEGRDSKTLRDFADHLRRRGLSPEQIRTICSDMSPAYIKGMSEEFGGAMLVFDYFHVVQLVSQALDQVRRRERREFPAELKGVRWAMLKGEDKQIPEMKRAARTIRAHWDGIVAYLKTRVTNGVAEALNWIIQTVKRKARGFRTVEYFSAMIHLVASHLQFNLPDPVPSTHTKSL
jgi:transposase